MSTPISRMSLRLSVSAFVVGLMHGCGHDRTTDIRPPRPQPTKPLLPKTAIADLGEGPVTLFEKTCSRCHGPQGSFYGDGFAKMDDQALHDRVEEMMKGPAQLEPSPLQIEAMVAYHRALREHRPFICVTNAAAFASDTETSLRGEVTPNASVTLGKGQVSANASVDQTTWSITNPPQPPFVIIASADRAKAQFDFPARLWSD